MTNPGDVDVSMVLQEEALRDRPGERTGGMLNFGVLNPMTKD